MAESNPYAASGPTVPPGLKFGGERQTPATPASSQRVPVDLSSVTAPPLTGSHHDPYQPTTTAPYYPPPPSHSAGAARYPPPPPSSALSTSPYPPQPVAQNRAGPWHPQPAALDNQAIPPYASVAPGPYEYHHPPPHPSYASASPNAFLYQHGQGNSYAAQGPPPPSQYAPGPVPSFPTAQPYNPASFLGPRYQPGISGATAYAPPPTTPTDPAVPAALPPGQGMGQRFRPRVTRFGTQLSGLVQTKVQGYLTTLATAQQGTATAGSTTASTSTVAPQSAPQQQHQFGAGTAVNHHLHPPPGVGSSWQQAPTTFEAPTPITPSVDAVSQPLSATEVAHTGIQQTSHGIMTPPAVVSKPSPSPGPPQALPLPGVVPAANLVPQPAASMPTQHASVAVVDAPIQPSPSHVSVLAPPPPPPPPPPDAIPPTPVLTASTSASQHANLPQGGAGHVAAPSPPETVVQALQQPAIGPPPQPTIPTALPSATQTPILPFSLSSKLGKAKDLVSRMQKMTLEQLQPPPSSSSTSGSVVGMFAALQNASQPRPPQPHEQQQSAPGTLPDSTGPASAAYTDPTGEYYTPEILTEATMRASGDPLPVPRMCYSSWARDKVPGDTFPYFAHPAAPDFLVCPWCHDRHLRGSPLAEAFAPVRRAGGVCCLFCAPRVTNRLWPAARRSGDLGPLLEYMQARSRLLPCAGAKGVVAAADTPPAAGAWYVLAGQEVADFLVCRTCYEDVAAAAAFADRFVPDPDAQPPGTKYVCGLATGYGRRALLLLSSVPDRDAAWAEWVRGVTKVQGLPECKRESVSASSRTWYRPRGSTGVHFCETCFVDQVALLDLAAGFETVDTSKNSFALLTCDLWPLSMRMLLWSCSAQRLGMDAFRVGAELVAAAKPCFTKSGIQDGLWYNLASREAKEYAICEGCYAALFVPNGMAAFMTPRPRPLPAGSAYYCAFNGNFDHFDRFYQRFWTALGSGVFSIYEEHVRTWAPMSRCKGKGTVSGGAWTGWPECAACAECHANFVAGTALEGSLPLRQQYFEGERSCSLYSPQMREKYTAACASGSADELLAFSRRRQEVHRATVERLKLLRDTADAERNMGDALMQIYTNHIGISSMDAAIGVGSSLTWDPSTGGYRSSDRVAADEAWAKAQACYARANDPSLWAEMERLETTWKEVE